LDVGLVRRYCGSPSSKPFCLDEVDEQSVEATLEKQPQQFSMPSEDFAEITEGKETKAGFAKD